MINFDFLKNMNRKLIANITIAIIVYITILFSISVIFHGLKSFLSDIKNNETSSSDVVATTTTIVATTTTTTKPIIKASLTLDVPYTVQAPYANWVIHEESCEEAAVLMVHDYLEGIKYNGTVIDKETANSTMIAMKNWQVANYGKEPDLAINAIGQFAKDYYGYNYVYKENITAEDIKIAITEGYPVIVPVITHSLQNPNYGVHPVYHVLLIKGYDASGVVTNDAGVSQGENRHYTWEILFSAIDAQTSQMNQGRVMVVIKK